MADELRVDPADLHVGAAQVEVHAEEMMAAHTQAHGQMAEAAPGIVGASVAALAALTSHWEAESAGQFAEMIEHSEKFRSAATQYDSTDSATSSQIDGAARAIADNMGL